MDVLLDDENPARWADFGIGSGLRLDTLWPSTVLFHVV
jgi:hypothetical protein